MPRQHDERNTGPVKAQEYVPVTGSAGSGRAPVTIAVPAREEDESEEGFEYRKRQAQDMIARMEIASEIIDRKFQEGVDPNPTEAGMRAARDLSAMLEGTREVAGRIDELPEGEQRSNLKLRNEFEQMRLLGQLEALQTYLSSSLDAVSTPEGGIGLFLDTKGKPVPAAKQPPSSGPTFDVPPVPIPQRPMPEQNQPTPEITPEELEAIPRRNPLIGV